MFFHVYSKTKTMFKIVKIVVNKFIDLLIPSIISIVVIDNAHNKNDNSVSSIENCAYKICSPYKFMIVEKIESS